jgi:hypothetical protein
MALKLIANYSKRLGLPGYSSHQFSVCVEAEINNVDDIAGESSRLYRTLQTSVDEEIQHTGFVPADGYGATNSSKVNGHGANGTWQCSEKQRELILRLIEEHDLNKTEVEALAQNRFSGKGVRQLNKLEASGLIDELLDQLGEKPLRPSRPRNGTNTNGSRR